MHILPLILLVLILPATMGACSDSAPPPATGCNGFDDLCERPLDQVVFAKTHNSHASEDRFYNIASRNHMSAVPTQLADGIRSLNFDVYYEEYLGATEIWVCHGYCALGWQPFVDILAEVRQFLDDNPREVVLLDFESYISAADTVASFDSADLTKYTHAQTPGSPWPTLQQMIDDDRRLVVFTSNEPGSPAWYHDDAAFMYGTDWGTETKQDFNCTITSGPIEHGLFGLNHTLTNPISQIEFAEEVNYNPFLLDRARDCEQQVGRMINIVEVDYYETGDVLETVAILNGVAD